MEGVSRSIEQIIRDLGLAEQMQLAAVRRQFSELFSPPLTDHLWPASLTRGELLIYVDSQVWLYEVRRHQREFEKRLLSFGVKRVKFRIGRVFRKKNPHEIPPLTKPDSLPEELEALIQSDIKDDSLRESVRKAMLSVLGRRISE
jgi:hypothetical protein